MKLKKSQYAEARRILKTYDKKFFKIQNVNGSSIEFKNGRWHLNIKVTQKEDVHDKLLGPKGKGLAIKGLPIVIDEEGEIWADAPSDAPPDILPNILDDYRGTWRHWQNGPCPGGVSIGHEDVVGSGTFGCTCWKAGTKYILSNNHVLANCNAGEAGDIIYQPGYGDLGGTRKHQGFVLGELSEYVEIVWDDEETPNKVDAAIAKPNATAWTISRDVEDPDSKWESIWAGLTAARDGFFTSNVVTAFGDYVGHYLEFTCNSIPCSKVAIIAAQYRGAPSYEFSDPDISIDLYYDDDWHNIFSGTITHSTWVEKTNAAGTKTVTKARVKWNGEDDPETGAQLYEFYFENQNPIEDEIYELQHPRGSKAAEVDMQVIKSGRTSEVTRSTITEFSGLVSVNYGGGNIAYFDDLVVSHIRMSRPGDSGSVWLDNLDNKAVGLGFASGAKAYACRMTEVTDALGITIFDYDPAFAVVTTQAADIADENGTFQATLRGNVVAVPSTNPTRYFEWGTEPGVYTEEENCGVAGVGAYNAVLNGLDKGQIYYYRTKVVDDVGTDYGYEESFIYGGWIRPTSADAPNQDPGGGGNYWHGYESAWDYNIGSFAYCGMNPLDPGWDESRWCDFIEFTFPDDTEGYLIQFYSQRAYCDEVDIDAYYDGGWNHIHEGDYASRAWVYLTIPDGPKTVEKIRIRFHLEGEEGNGIAYICEIATQDLTPPEPPPPEEGWTDWKITGTGANVDRDGKPGLWNTPTNVQVDDANRANCFVPAGPEYGDWLRCTNFGFDTDDVPEGATIEGIQVRIKKYSGWDETVADSALYLRNAAAETVGDNKASATWWTNPESEVDHGAIDDNWNAGILDTDVRNANFGFQISILNADEDSGRTGSVYVAWMRVYASTGPRWKKLLYTTEPPTLGAWNQVKQEDGTGWKKLLYT